MVCQPFLDTCHTSFGPKVSNHYSSFSLSPDLTLPDILFLKVKLTMKRERSDDVEIYRGVARALKAFPEEEFSCCSSCCTSAAKFVQNEDGTMLEIKYCKTSFKLFFFYKK